MAINYEYSAAAVRHFAAKLELEVLSSWDNPEDFTVFMVIEIVRKAAKKYAEEEMMNEQEKAQKEVHESPELLVNN